MENMRARIEDERIKLASCEKRLEEKSVEVLKISSQSKKLQDELAQKAAILANVTSKFEDCKQQVTQLEAQNAKIKRAIG